MVDSSPDIRRRIASIRPEYVLRCSWMFYNCSSNLGNVLTQTNCRSTTQYCRTKALFYIVPRGALLYYRVWMHIYDDYIKKKNIVVRLFQRMMDLQDFYALWPVPCMGRKKSSSIQGVVPREFYLFIMKLFVNRNRFDP